MDNFLESLPSRLAENLVDLRKKQNLSQLELAQKAGIPRSTLTYLESGESNPSITNLIKVTRALEVSLEELLSARRPEVQLIRANDVPVELKSRGRVQVEKILPDPIPGMEIDKITLEPGARMKGTPHIARTKEYLCCLNGKLQLYVKKKSFDLNPGDILSFPGDVAHAYENLSLNKKTMAFSVVVFAPSGI